ncbi:MAG: T9SS type A sorting domain-containing protein [Bacteroidia bacterium]|nr:T9SS type A sorting domain-containing protein [Bacteroidia bacterium]
MNTDQETINLDLSTGMYFYQVKDNKRFISTGKLIIQ